MLTTKKSSLNQITKNQNPLENTSFNFKKTQKIENLHLHKDAEILIEV